MTQTSNSSQNTATTLKWVRARRGNGAAIAGICQGLGRSFNTDPIVLRIIWLVALFVFGAGLVLYLVLWMTLPLENEASGKDQGKLLGVCSRLAQRVGLEVGLVRALTILITLMSGGTALILYVILHFVIPQENLPEKKTQPKADF